MEEEKKEEEEEFVVVCGEEPPCVCAPLGLLRRDSLLVDSDEEGEVELEEGEELEEAGGEKKTREGKGRQDVTPGPGFISIVGQREEDGDGMDGNARVDRRGATGMPVKNGKKGDDNDSDRSDAEIESGSEEGEMTAAAASRFPWMRSRSAATRCMETSSPLLRLHIEIVEFVRLMSPTVDEVDERMRTKEAVGDVVRSIWPSASVEVFGSFRTGLYLPSSDIDVVIMNSGCSNQADGLKALAIALSRRGLARNLQVIAKARVPIVKFTEPKSGIQFDVSFDMANGPAAAEFVAREVKRFPALKPLSLVLKIFLQQRELNEVYSGGIGSYGLLIMIISHIQMSGRYEWAGAGDRRSMKNDNDNLGQLLYNFFDLYGRKLNTQDVGVSCRGGGGYFRKRDRDWFNESRPNLISLEDPQDAENDVGKNSYNYSQLRSAFEYAHQLLTIAMLKPHTFGESILGAILRPDKMLRRRSQKHELDDDASILLPQEMPVDAAMTTTKKKNKNKNAKAKKNKKKDVASTSNQGTVSAAAKKKKENSASNGKQRAKKRARTDPMGAEMEPAKKKNTAKSRNVRMVKGGKQRANSGANAQAGTPTSSTGKKKQKQKQKKSAAASIPPPTKIKKSSIFVKKKKKAKKQIASSGPV